VIEMSDIQKISRILFQFWDPIGVNENKNLENEYDSYASEIIRMFKNKNYDFQSYLVKVEKEMGLKQNIERAKNIENMLISNLNTLL
jgi:hypothetical protein